MRNKTIVGLIMFVLVFSVFIHAQEKKEQTKQKEVNKMIYLVTMEVVETKVPTSLPEMIRHMEQEIIPSHEAMIKLKAEGKILAGGAQSGRRAEAFIVEGASNEELDELLRSFPHWPLMKVDVTPLQSWESVLAKERQLLERLKAALK